MSQDLELDKGRRTDKPKLVFSDPQLWTRCTQPPPAPGASVPATMAYTSQSGTESQLVAFLPEVALGKCFITAKRRVSNERSCPITRLSIPEMTVAQQPLTV